MAISAFDIKKTVLCTILYNPDDSALLRIQNSADLGCQMYILDNTPGSDHPVNPIKHPLIRFFSFGKNIGIGPALRLMCATASYDGFLQLLFFDQDTIYTESTLNYIGDFSSLWLKQNYKPLNKFACITFRDFLPTSRNHKLKKITLNKYSIIQTDFTISSGSLFDLVRLRASGWHDETFFIDGVDYAVCLSIAKSGYYVGEIGPTPGLDHHTEQDDHNYKIFEYSFRGRPYPFYRFRDFLISSMRLLILSLQISPRKTLWILRSLIVFIGHQVLVRFARKI